MKKLWKRLNLQGCLSADIPETEETQVLDYLKRRKEKGQRVYCLAGASDWGVEEDGASMLEAVRITAEWNKKRAERKVGLPALFSMWSRIFWKNGMTIRRAVWNSMQPTGIQAYQSAREEKLAVIICIPNFYDRIGLSELLEKIIEEGCDGIAVMNYNKKNEAGQIEEELRLAEKYGKGILNITEMQMQGYHGPTEENTYYDDGFGAVADSWEKLKAKVSPINASVFMALSEAMSAAYGSGERVKRNDKMNEVLRQEKKYLLSYDQFRRPIIPLNRCFSPGFP